MDPVCSRCRRPADDGPVFSGAGLVCWLCADDLFQAMWLPWGDPAAAPDNTSE